MNKNFDNLSFDEEQAVKRTKENFEKLRADSQARLNREFHDPKIRERRRLNIRKAFLNLEEI